MPQLNRSEVYTQRMGRLFFQLGGPAPNNPLTYYGLNAQYAMLDGVTQSYGAVDPIYVRDPLVTDKYRAVGRQRNVPDLPTATLTLMQKIGSLPRDLGEQGCDFNLYLPVGNCKSLADFNSGWDYVEILAGCVAEERDGGDVFPMEGDEARTDAYSLKAAETYRVGQLAFGEKAAAQIDREVIDLVWGGGPNCGECGPADDGATRLYAVTVSSGAGSPGIQAEVIYVNRDKNTGAVTVYEYALTYLSTSEQPAAIGIMGDYLIVVSNDAGSYAYALISSIDGTLGSFTEVATGIVATKEPNDLFVANPFQAYLCGDGGYIYSLTDVTAGVSVLDAGDATTQNLNRISGDGQSTIVAVGAAATVVASTNGGDSFSTTNAAPGAAALTAVAVKDQYHWWVGGASRYYTRNGGYSWVQQAIASATSLNDILFVTPEVGYTLYITADECRLQATIDGGERWADVGPGEIVSRVRGWADFDVGNRLAAPNSTPQIACANLAVGGRLGASGTDGRLLIGASALL
jgi:hypothetical protein